MATVRPATAAGVVLIAASPAWAGPSFTFDGYSARLAYGVYADGGANTTPEQGGVNLTGGGQFSWSQIDGVAQAAATANVLINLVVSPEALTFSGRVGTSASATVGDNPVYGFERGQAEVWLDRLTVGFVTTSVSQLTITGTSWNEIGEGVGLLGPGTYTLAPGAYFLRLPGTAARSSVDAGVSQTRTASGSVDFGVFLVIPGPGTGTIVLAGLAGGLHRRRRPRAVSSGARSRR